MKFLLDGQRVVPDQTPAELDLEDGDQIDCGECHEPGAGVAVAFEFRGRRSYSSHSRHCHARPQFSSSWAGAEALGRCGRWRRRASRQGLSAS